MQKWLQLEIANKNKVAANIDFSFLESSLWSYLKELDPNQIEINLLSKDELQLILFEVFIHHQSKYLTIFKKYIAQNTSVAFQRKKIWGLAEKLASLLLEYEYQRPEMIEKWLNADGDHLNFDEQENAQCYLYTFLLHPENGLLTKLKKPYSTLYQYSKKVFSSNSSLSIKTDQKCIHLFAISQISVFHQSLLKQLEPYYDFHIYAFNPCAELWEDVHTKSEEKWLKKNNFQENLMIESLEEEVGEVSYELEDSPFLKNWGKTGREYIKLMSRMVNYDFCTSYLSYLKEGQTDSILQKIQQDIVLRNNPSLKESDWIQDLSLQIFKAPSISREVQTVFQHILHVLNNDDELSVHDIVVLVSDLDKYLPYIHSVFDGDQHDLPYCILGDSASRDSAWGQGLLSVLSLGLSQFNREDVFHCLENICLMEKYNYSDVEIKQWMQWVDDLGIHHHFDSNGRLKDGYDDSNFYTWNQGLKRLRYGLFFNKENETAYPEFTPYHTSSSDIESLDKFIYILEKLNSVSLKSQTWFTSKQWIEHVKKINRELLVIPKGETAENKYAASFLESLDSILIFDEIADHLNEKNQLDLEIIISILKSNMDKISSIRGSFLISGITISEIQAMRVFPFKKTYILGLDSKSFPGKEVLTPLDLRIKQRKIGDISLPDRNRYFFLEKLMTTEQLILSWVHKDLVKDETFEPATVIQQLIENIESRFQDKENKFTVAEMPLWNWDTAQGLNDTTNDLSFVYNAMDENLSKVMANHKTIEDVKSEAKNDFQCSFDYSIAAPQPKEEVQEIELSISNLNKYLNNTAFAEIEFKLGAKESEYDEEVFLDQNIESITLDTLKLYKLHNTILNEYISKCHEKKSHLNFEKEILQILKKELNRLKLKNKAINGSYFDFLIVSLKKKLLDLKPVINKITPEILESPFFYEEIVYGADHQHNHKSLKRIYSKPAMKIFLDGKDFYLRGAIPLIWKNENTLCHFQNYKEAKYKSGKFSSILMMFFIVAYGDNKLLEDVDELIIHFIDKTVSLEVDLVKIKEYCDKLLIDFSGNNAELFFIYSGFTTVLNNFIKKDELYPDKIETSIKDFKRKSDFEENTRLIDYCRIADFSFPENIKEIIEKRFVLLFSLKEVK